MWPFKWIDAVLSNDICQNQEQNYSCRTVRHKQR